jgi:hypothetical protein
MTRDRDAYTRRSPCALWPQVKKSLRHDEMRVVLGARHRDVEQPSLLLNFRHCSGTEVRGNAAVDHMEHEHGLPFLSFCGMNG